MSSKSDEDKETEKPLVAKTPVELQRLKLMKLMKNPVSFNFLLINKIIKRTIIKILINN